MKRREKDGIGSGRKPIRPLIRKAAMMVAQGAPVSQAMKTIGYAKSTLSHPEKLTAKPEFVVDLKAAREKVAEFCVAHNVTIDRWVKKVSDGVSAKLPVKIKRMAGEVLIESDVPDHEAQVKWWDRGAMLLGIEKEMDPEDGKVQPVNIALFVKIIEDARKSRGLPV